MIVASVVCIDASGGCSRAASTSRSTSSNARAGAEAHGHRDRASFEPRAQPMPRRVQRDRTADPEMGPQQRARAGDRDTRRRSRSQSSTGCATPDSSRCSGRRLASSSGAGGGRRHDRVTEPLAPARTRRRRCRFSAAIGRRWRARPRGARSRPSRDDAEPVGREGRRRARAGRRRAWRRSVAIPRAARRARRARDWSPGTACRPPLRAGDAELAEKIDGVPDGTRGGSAG